MPPALPVFLSLRRPDQAEGNSGIVFSAMACRSGVAGAPRSGRCLGFVRGTLRRGAGMREGIAARCIGPLDGTRFRAMVHRTGQGKCATLCTFLPCKMRFYGENGVSGLGQRHAARCQWCSGNERAKVQHSALVCTTRSAMGRQCGRSASWRGWRSRRIESGTLASSSGKK